VSGEMPVTLYTLANGAAAELFEAELRECLAQCWSDSTSLANWTVTERAKEDMVRSAADKKLTAAPARYLYPDARRRVPDMTSQSVVSLLQAVDRKYRKRRLEAIWRSSESLPRYRYPVPYPTHNQGWRIRREKDIYILSLRMHGEPWELRLRGGHGFWRQQRMMDRIISEDAVQGELAVYRTRSHDGDHRNGTPGRTDGERISCRVMAKMVAWLPRAEQPIRTGLVMSLRTGGDHFWTATISADIDPWYINADHVRVWIVGHERFRQRNYDDRKPEIPRKYGQREMDQKCQKHHNRLKSFAQMAIAALSGYTKRMGISRVIYHDVDRSYLPSFGWADLATALGVKLDEYGIAFEHASGEVMPESPQALAEEEHAE